VTKYLEKNRENGRSATTPYTYLAHPHIGSFHFLYRGAPIETMNNTVWQQARVRAGLPQVRIHDLKHTFGATGASRRTTRRLSPRT